VKKLLHMSLVIVIALITVIGVGTFNLERAEATSSGCTDFANIGSIITESAYSIGGWTFETGETILVTARVAIVPTAPELAPALGGSSVFLEVNGVVVDSAIAIFPVTLSYTFPANGDYSWAFYTNGGYDIDWKTDCLPGPEAGCDVQIPLPEWAVVGQFTADTVLEWEPGQATDATVEAGNTTWVLGVNEAGTHYLVYWGCTRAWVPIGNMGPNYDEVWNGTPLPTVVVD
jgi:hypothetical protein